MNNQIQKRAIIITAGVLCITVIYFVLIGLLEYRLSGFLEKQEGKGMAFSYNDISLNLIKRAATVEGAQVVLNDSLGSNFTGKVSLDALKIKNVRFFHLLFNGSLDIDAIELNELNGTLFKRKKLISDELKDTTSSATLDIDVKLSHLILTNSNVKIYDTEEDSLFLSLQNFNIDVTNILIDNNTLSKSLPFVSEDYLIASDSIFLKASRFENLTISGINGNHQQTILRGIKYQNKYSPEIYSSLISTEGDHYDIEIDTIALDNTSMTAINDQKLSMGIQKIGIINPSINIYRDKLVADEHTEKNFYSKILRESPMDISIDTFNFKNANLVYTERIKRENRGGDIHFNEMNISMKNLGNTYTDHTIIEMDANFMNATPFFSKWTFNVDDESDAFYFEGEIGFLDVNAMNQFTVPNMDVDLEGRINKLFFKINGNSRASRLDLSVNYDHLAVGILNHRTKRKRKLLSSMANLLLSNKSKNAESNFKSVQIDVERDEQKSFISFVFKNIKEGMQKVIL